jgi:hypothetical protein
MLQLSAQEIINRFQQSLDSLAGRPSTYSRVQIYYDGRLGDNQLERDALMATICHNIQPMDTVGEYLTRYEVSQRAWQIVEQEFLKPQWWNFAIRRFVTELFNENADHAEALFRQGLRNHYHSASDVDSANNYSFAYVQPDKYQDHSSDHSSELDRGAYACTIPGRERTGKDGNSRARKPSATTGTKFLPTIHCALS